MTNNKDGYLKKIIGNIGWMLFDKIFILVLNLVVTVQIANYYGTLGYGTYQYAVSVVALFEILVTFVDARVVKKKYSSNSAEDLVWNASITRMLFSVLSLIVGLIYLLLCGESKEYNFIFVILLMNAVIVNLRFGMQNRYEYLLKSRKIIIASNIALVIGGALQLLATSMHLSIQAIAVITAFSSLLSLMIAYAQYKREFGKLIQGRYNKSLVSSLILESIPLAVAASCAIIYSRCDSIMIGNILSKEDVGIYAIAIKLIMVVQIGIAPIRESVYPKMIELYHTNRKLYEKRYIQITAVLTWVYIIGVLLSFVVFPYAFRFLNSDYADAFPVYQLYVIGTFFMYNAGLRAGHYTLINRGKVLMYSQIISVMMNIALNFVLIRNMGLYGAAISTSITQGVSLLISNLFFGKEGRKVFIWQLKSFYFIKIFRK